MSTTTQALGVVAIVTDPTGRVVASVSDFDRSGYGGFKLREAQEHRVRRAIALEVVRTYCSEAILPAIEPYDCEQILRRLQSKGWHSTIIPIGHDDGLD